MPTSPAPAPRAVKRKTKIALIVLGILIALPCIAIAILLNYDWNKARPWLNARTSEAIGRPFAIEGNLSLQWERLARPDNWRDYIPWPHLVANDIHVGNPAGMPARDMASVRQFSFSLNPLALLNKTIAIPLLQFDTPSVELLRDADGKNNWTFKQDTKPSPWKLDLARVVFSKGVVHLDDTIEHADIRADVDTLDADPTYGVGWTLRGSLNGAPVSGKGKAGAVLSLKQQTTPYPVLAEFHSGPTHISAVGSVTRPARLAAIDLQLTLAGASMARLYNITGLLLPETPAFSTEGRLIGTLDDQSSHWTYEKFKGKVGSSDIGGRLEYQTGKPRGMLTGDVRSQLLTFSDLGPLIGADSNASKTARGVAPVQPAGKVLPVEAFHTERWTTLDADVKFSAERIVRDKQLPISKLSTHVLMRDGVLTLDPLNFLIAGGSLNSAIKLDGSGRQGKNAIMATAKVTARHIEIKQLFPTIEKLQATVGQINGDAQLSATGNSVASLLAASNGEIKTLIDHGTVSKLLLEEMGLNVGNVVLTKLIGDKPVKLNCMATDFGVTKGVMQTRSFVVDTEEALINVTGNINLADERLDLTLKPDTKNLRLVTLRAPIYVRGTFSNPDVSIDKKVLAMKAGGAVALATLAAPLAAMLPLINTGPGQNSECAKLLAEARVKPVAPPPARGARKQ